MTQIPQKDGFDLHAGVGFSAVDPCGNHLGIVKDQHISRIQVVDHIVKDPVFDGLIPTIQHHQPGTVPWLQRRLGDAVLGKVIVKILCRQGTGRAFVVNHGG